MLYINLNVLKRLYLCKQQYTCLFNFSYPIEMTHHASFQHQFNSPTSKKHFCPTIEFQKILISNITILEQQNNKQRLQILKAVHIRNKHPELNKINFESVLMYSDLFTAAIYRIKFQNKRHNSTLV